MTNSLVSLLNQAKDYPLYELDAQTLRPEGISEPCELLFACKTWVIYRTVRKYETSDGDVHANWYLHDFEEGVSYNLTDYTNSNPDVEVSWRSKFPLDPLAAVTTVRGSRIIVEGQHLPPTNHHLSEDQLRMIGDLTEARISGDQIKQSFQSSGRDLTTILQGSVKLQHDHEGGWNLYVNDVRVPILHLIDALSE